MKEQIKIVFSKGTSQFDVTQFNKRAKVVFEKHVKPQIKRAAVADLPKEVMKYNNPV